jgi:hypothetical protein
MSEEQHEVIDLERVTGAKNDDIGEFYYKHKADGSVEAYIGLSEGSIIRRDDFDADTWDNDTTNWPEPIPGSPKQKIRKAQTYYTRDPLVNKSVKLLAQLANDTFSINAEDDDVEEFFENWWEDIEGNSLLSYFFLEYFRSGNVVIFKTLIPYKPKKYEKNPPEKPEGGQITAREEFSNDLFQDSQQAAKEYNDSYDALTQAIALHSEGWATAEEVQRKQKAFSARKYVWSRKMIPGGYTILNPLSIEIKGPEGLPWARAVYLTVDQQISKAVKEPIAEVKELVSVIPKEILSQIKRGDREVYLPSHMVGVVTRDKQPYEKWAEPLTTHAFEALDLKYEMRDMDKKTVRGVRNRILKVTIGNDQYPVFDPTIIKKLATEFNNPSRTMTIFWNHTLNIEYIEPNLDSLNKDKYMAVDEDIRTNFGIAKVLTGNSGESVGNNVLNLKGLVEVLTEAQTAFLDWFNKEAKRISQALSLPEVPEGAFGKLNLKDENDFIRVIMQLVDRQIISYESAVETIGYHFPREVERLKKEEKLRQKENILVPQKAPTQQGGGGNEGGGPSGQEGRPPGQTEEEPREGREGGTRSPDGQKLVASIANPLLYEKIRESAVEMYHQGAAIFAMSEDKAVASEPSENQKVSAWKNVCTILSEEYKIEQAPIEILAFCAVRARKTHQQNPETEFEQVMASTIAMYIAQEQSQ